MHLFDVYHFHFHLIIMWAHFRCYFPCRFFLDGTSNQPKFWLNFQGRKYRIILTYIRELSAAWYLVATKLQSPLVVWTLSLPNLDQIIIIHSHQYIDILHLWYSVILGEAFSLLTCIFLTFLDGFGSDFTFLEVFVSAQSSHLILASEHIGLYLPR